MNIFITRLKVLIRDKATMFWAFIFPLGMSLFFYLGFGTIDFVTPVETLSINVINKDDYKLEDSMVSILESIKYEEGTSMFSLNYLESIESAEDLYINGNIDNYFYMNNDKYELYSSNQSITISIQTVVTEYNNFEYFLTEKLSKGETNIESITNSYFSGLSESFIDSKTIVDQSNMASIYFFALISMICLYASQLGIRVVMDVRADNSFIGIRAGVTPTKRSTLLGIYFLVSLMLEILGSTILVFFIKFILKVEFGNLFLVLITTWLGCILGITAGMMAGCICKGSRSAKENIMSALALFSCFLAGLMVFNMKHILDVSLGMLSKINPATPITDALFSLYFYEGYKNYLIDLGFIVGLSVIFFIVVLVKMRGEKYESL